MLQSNRGRRAFIVWLQYQRRTEVLAPLLHSEVRYFPHVFRSRALRPLDYLFKLILSIFHFVRRRPGMVFVQVPPVFPALAAVLTKTPYIMDVHNGLIQGIWSRIPLTGALTRGASALIAHNPEIAGLIKKRFPSSRVFTISDPVQVIDSGSRKRDGYLFICSFGVDEPVRLILDTVRALPECSFTITGNPQRLSRDVRTAFARCGNARLPGFLPTCDYHSLLCSSKAAVVLTTRSAVQPSGACEALASNTPLILTRTDLTESLFGAWALLVDNSVDSLVTAIRSVKDDLLDLTDYRCHWNRGVEDGVAELEGFLSAHNIERKPGDNLSKAYRQAAL